MPGMKPPCDSDQTPGQVVGPVRCREPVWLTGLNIAAPGAGIPYGIGNEAESCKSGRHQRKGAMKEVMRHLAGSLRSSCGESPMEHKAGSTMPSHGGGQPITKGSALRANSRRAGEGFGPLREGKDRGTHFT